MTRTVQDQDGEDGDGDAAGRGSDDGGVRVVGQHHFGAYLGYID